MRFILIPAFLALAACPALAAPDDTGLVGRLTWGPTADGRDLDGLTASRWLDQQLHPSDDDGLPPAVQAQIAALTISTRPMEEIAIDVKQLQLAAKDAKGTDSAKDARKPYQEALNGLAREAQTRSLLRDLYSRNQLKEQLTWFWLNHFNVHAQKGEIRALVGDYEETAIRPHVLGPFRELLAATLFHPAMIQYLDNQQNAVGKINENYAREIMELHTMGVGSGYSQTDVQELARILTGVGVNLSGQPRRVGPFFRNQGIRNQYVSDGLFEFNPRRHDYGDKVFLGQAIKGTGLDEVSQAIDILARQPATAKLISTQLAQYFCCDAPSEALVGAMSATFRKSDGNIADVLRTLFASAEFRASLGRKFKDPMHWTVSALRASFGSQVITNTQPAINWLNRMGEPLYDHETPDGYPLIEAAWSGPGQMATRFEIARQIGAGAPQLFRADNAPPTPMPPPVLEQTAYYTSLALPAATRTAITQGATQADRNMLFLSSPDFMRR
jgi:uncharacterized protein (DUF1800 family)